MKLSFGLFKTFVILTILLVSLFTYLVLDLLYSLFFENCFHSLCKKLIIGVGNLNFFLLFFFVPTSSRIS